ncbi:hypothetical protein BS78_02G027000 [Paspalum vaginatum]|nr:hypothetical protein BS78_02G027000 [Paspalum vaginatum]
MSSGMGRTITQVCPRKVLNRYAVSVDKTMWKVNGLMMFNAVLMLLVVAIAAYAPRYRRHPLIRFLFLGASTLFLPIISSVAATIGGSEQYYSGALVGRQVVAARCEPGIHIVLVLVWTGLVVLIGINTSAVVAGDAREGRDVGPPVELFFKAVWVAYLVYGTITQKGFLSTTRYLKRLLGSRSFGKQVFTMFALLTCLIILKWLFKFFTFRTARKSVALGRSPRLIVGYMARPELNESQGTEPPALIVQGEEAGHVEKQPQGGYIFTATEHGSQLVTLDMVWGLDDHRLGLGGGPSAAAAAAAAASEPKDLCFSFALFKLLRCRFAKYTVSDAGFMKACRFFQATLLQGDDYARVFRVVADELSFIHDYYYSPRPGNVFLSLVSISYCSAFLSALSIGFCVYVLVSISLPLRHIGGYEQVYCKVWCPNSNITRHRRAADRSLYSIGRGNNVIGTYVDFGNTYYDLVPVYLMLAVLVLSEMRDMFSCIASKWRKVALVCKYARTRNASPEVSTTTLQRRIAFVFRWCGFAAVKSWEGKMNQCSILARRRRWGISIRLPERLQGLMPNQKTKIKVPPQVKAQIFEALKQEGLIIEQDDRTFKIRQPLCPFSSNAFTACNGRGAADTILAWHIATSIMEVRHPEPSSDAKVAATVLSRYCAYLVIYLPELLPDDAEWCESLHQDVRKDAYRVLCSSAGRQIPAATPEAEYQQLLDLLITELNQVLAMGARLGQQLAALQTDDHWGPLARFWSEMILYVAPSENLGGHAEAIAGGGELITLLWALLAHAGVVSRVAGAPPPPPAPAAADADANHSEV